MGARPATTPPLRRAAQAAAGLLGAFGPVRALPILPEHLFCHNSSVQLQAAAGGVTASIPCDAGAFGTGTVCCEDEDVAFVLEHLQHTLEFGQRHIADRQEFQEQYSRLAVGEHPCGPAIEAAVSPRLQLLGSCQVVSEDALDLLRASAGHVLCAACRGAPAGGAAPPRGAAPGALADTEAALAAEWARLSRAVADMYAALRGGDAEVAAALASSELSGCAVELAASLGRGVAAPAATVIPVRPWSHAGDGVHGFREMVRRWIDALLALSAELAEQLVAEVEGLILALSHAAGPATPAQELLARPPPPAPTAVAGAGWPLARSGSASPLLARGQGEERILLLVVMPNPGTNLRFDFSSDPATLSLEALRAHVDALSPLLDAGSAARVVVITANPEQAALLAQEFRLRGGGTALHVVWRRFALFQADGLCALYSAEGPVAPAGAPRAAAVFEVGPGGAVEALGASARALRGGASPAGWPAALRPATASAWPAKVSAARPSALLRPPGWLGEGPCPAAAEVLQEYLRYHAAARERLRKGKEERVLVYRCSALGFCGGHGDRLNGLLGVFLLAVAARRAFFIDAPRPVPLELLLAPRRRPGACGGEGDLLLDWRMHGAVAAAGRRVNYNDRYNDMVADIPWLLSGESENVVVLHSNQRISAPLLRSPEARAALGAGAAAELLATPWLHADLMEVLFEPSPLLAARYAKVSSAARNGRRRLLAIHFRAGNRSPERWSDPPRHALADLEAFLLCAAEVEKHLGWQPDEVAWYVASDTAEVEALPLFAQLRAQGKIAFLPAGHNDAAIVHLDRSPMAVAVHGLTDTWAQWLTIASAEAVVLSTSNFGVTAAEAGRVRHAFLGTGGCLPADVTAV